MGEPAFELGAPARDLGTMIDELVELREKKAYHEAQATAFSKEISIKEESIIHEMADQNLEKAAHNGVTVHAKKHVYAHVEDWNALWDFLIENRYTQLLERRVAVKAYRELLELGREIPGVVPNPIVKLSVTRTLR